MILPASVDLASLAIDHLVGSGDFFFQGRRVSHQLECRTRLIYVAYRMILEQAGSGVAKSLGLKVGRIATPESGRCMDPGQRSCHSRLACVPARNRAHEQYVVHCYCARLAQTLRLVSHLPGHDDKVRQVSSFSAHRLSAGSATAPSSSTEATGRASFRVLQVPVPPSRAGRRPSISPLWVSRSASSASTHGRTRSSTAGAMPSPASLWLLSRLLICAGNLLRRACRAASDQLRDRAPLAERPADPVVRLVGRPHQPCQVQHLSSARVHGEVIAVGACRRFIVPTVRDDARSSRYTDYLEPAVDMMAALGPGAERDARRRCDARTATGPSAEQAPRQVSLPVPPAGEHFVRRRAAAPSRHT